MNLLFFLSPRWQIYPVTLYLVRTEMFNIKISKAKGLINENACYRLANVLEFSITPYWHTWTFLFGHLDDAKYRTFVHPACGWNWAIGKGKKRFFQLFQNLRAGKAAQPGKACATKPDNLSPIPELPWWRRGLTLTDCHMTTWIPIPHPTPHVK